ncbi:AAA family ATPase [Microbacterium oleivorans]|uniref:AAA family ATPase n=1 Tax=Microbacterium oleivorans TaxID=273677 RepID=A0A4R5YEQ3_9MICO|nr:AAA family ATPase [Microbacterium oleivorans]TDL43591.1 AAA family ATPase [Microbacterium oleivorans]
MPSLNWVNIVMETDDAIVHPDLTGWADMSPEQRDKTPFGKMVIAVQSAYMRTKAQQLVQAAMYGTPDLVLTTEEEVLNRPSPNWLVEGLIQEDTICLFAGPGGIGKTFFSLALSRSIAAGGVFFGRKVRQGKVLYVAAEGTAAFGDRVRAWNSVNYKGVPRNGITYVESGVNLKDPDSVDRLANLIAEGDFSLVVLDTLSQLGYFDNENSNAEVAQVFISVKKLRDARKGTSVLVIDHTPAQGGKARGGTAKRDNSDTVIIAVREDEGFTVSTRQEDGGKQKDGEEKAWVGFGLQPTLNSAVLVNSGKRPTSPYWEPVYQLLSDGKGHKAAELRAACGMEGDARSAEAKRLSTQLDKWMSDKLITREGATANTLYRLSDQMKGVA